VAEVRRGALAQPRRDRRGGRGTRCPVAGNKTLWKKGVSGTALAFDGYFSKVTLPRDKAPAVKNELTLEAWVVLGAYPWNDAGIVHQSSGEPISPEEYKHGYRTRTFTGRGRWKATFSAWTLTGGRYSR